MNDKELKEFIAKRELAKKTADELMAIYKAWDYQYKPQFSCFLHEVVTVSNQHSFLEYLLRVRAQAYYAQSHPACDQGFDALACLIHIAFTQKIETPFDHVINSDKDFEWKLNNLFFEKK